MAPLGLHCRRAQRSCVPRSTKTNCKPAKHPEFSALEVSTIGTLRALNSAQASFASSCGGGAFAPTVASLATAATGRKSTAGFIGPRVTKDTVDKEHYRIRFTAGA